ncbi:FtsK/SpoIIIE domain-containing protein [Acutalibacter muris]|jgi:S-DNA-T family DNA segregation ATPase FtsK/SpoIIIE|uniref:FtsK/SpoIIIE domain-containing protein n=1 Tax=Acutalibacter muris TaxID=1796620 RepID=UPI0026F3E713|nr:FtsK/SpoIIIE domain-containing protein [Acutalibacter muris]
MNYLQMIVRWLWVPVLLSLVFVVMSVPQYRRKQFFSSIGFRGYDGKLPRYKGQRKVNTYLKRMRYRSTIPLEKWEKAKSDIEMFYNRKIYKLEQSKRNMHILYIYLIQELLPTYILWKDSYLEEGRKFAIGESYNGKLIWDCTVLPHGVVAGASSAGKSSVSRCIIHQATIKRWNVWILDWKCGGDYVSVEREYQDITKNYGPIVISGPEETRNILVAILVEVRGRLEEFKKVGATNIDEYNARGQDQFVPFLLVIDEAAEILDVKPKSKEEKDLYAEIEQTLRKLARISRAAGVHILMGFIRPDANVLDGQIKNNLLWRACGYFADPAASRIVLDSEKATKLPPEVKGRFIIGEEETQAYYLPIPEAGSGGEAEREPPEPPAASGGGVLD